MTFFLFYVVVYRISDLSFMYLMYRYWNIEDGEDQFI